MIENDVVIFRNQECEHRINKLETLYPKKDQTYERKILTFFIADPKNSVIPNSKDMELNKEVTDIQKDMIYTQKDEFKKGRFHMGMEKKKGGKLSKYNNFDQITVD